MNISAPASVPDLASRAQLAAPPEAAAIPGFAPPQSPTAGAGTFHNFGSTLAEVLSVEGELKRKPEEDPKQQEVNVVVTGVAIPAPAPETLPFSFAMPFQPAVKAESEMGQAQARLELLPGADYATSVLSRTMASSHLSLPFSLQPEDTVTPFAFTVPEPKAPEPQPAPAPELPNLAFTEKFTPAPGPQDVPPLTEAMRPLTGDGPTKFANNPADGFPSPEGTIGESDHAPGQRRGNGERQRSSGESLAQPRAYTEPSAREEAQTEKPGFQPQAPLSMSTKEIPPSESSQLAPGARPADMSHLEPAPNSLQSSPPTHTPDAHSISLRVTEAGEARVELKVTEHAGEVRVSVRTADSDLAGSLRENLGDLVHKLEQSGFRADTWHPSQSSSSEGNPQTRRAEGESLGEDHSGRQQQHSGDGRERKQQDPARAGWIDEFETSLGPDSERKAPTWLPA